MLPEPEKFGFDFEGWLNDEEQYVIASTPVTLASDHTLVADFKKIASTLTLILDGGELATEDGKMQWKKAFGEQVTLGVPTKEGYEFAGYDHMGGGSMTSSGTGADTLYTFTFDGVDAVITATWRAQTIKVTLQAEGGQVIVDGLEVGPTYEFSVVFGQRYDSIIGNLPTAKKYGYTFNGWEYDGTVYPAGETFIVPDAPYQIVEGEYEIYMAYITLTASWTPNQHTITYDGNGAASGVPAAQQAGYETTVTAAAAPVREGYTFTGWLSSTGETYPAGGTFTMPDSDMTLTAQWEVANTDGISSAGSYYLLRGQPYSLNGVTKTEGDEGVYAGGITFYVPSNGYYTFTE